MDALEKILLAAGSPASPQAEEDDPGADLVAASSALLDELVILLASDDDEDDDSDSDSDSDDDEDEDDDNPKGKGKKKGKKAPPWLSKKAKGKKVAACALAAAARLALDGLNSRPEGYDWVEATSVPLTARETLALAKGEHAAPYGSDVAYADPGYRGKKRYPIDEKHIHAALSYFSKPANRSEYTSDQVKAIWGRIKAAAKRFGVEMAPKTAAASHVTPEALLELAGVPMAEPVALTPMHHGPFNGSHAHPHATTSVVHSKHFHNNDSRHGDDRGGW